MNAILLFGMQDGSLPLLAIPGSFLAFGCFWTFLLFLLSVVGGWSRLGQAYRAFGRTSGTSWRIASGSVGWTNYSNCLVLTSNPQGLGMAVWLPFRPGHPPLFIPWDDVQATQTTVLGFFPRTELTFRRTPGVRVRLGNDLARKLFQAGGR